MADPNDLDRALAGDKDLVGADLRSADLSYASLSSADLRSASLSSADLSGASLSSADLSRADLSRANLEGANLSNANLEGANLRAARLRHATLRGAILIGAKLYRTDLAHADLRNADLAAAEMEDANLEGANLSNAYLSNAYLRSANLSDASLSGANLYGADLTRANLSGAILNIADIRRANLTGANLEGANLSNANLEGANLSNANFSYAYFTRANLTGANLEGANLEGANFGESDLTDANLEGANLRGANLRGAKGLRSKAPVARGRSYGKASGAVLKLLAEGPQSARDFKRKHPAEFERLKPLTGGRDFTRETINAVVAKTRGARWIITRTAYASAAQRHCPTANDVLLFNIDLDAERLTDRQRGLLRKLSEVSRRSGHPHERGDKLFSVGWVRYCPGEGVWLVEEVQSDVQAARFGLKDQRAREQLAQGGISPDEFEDAVAALAPWTERFYEDALGVTFALAKQRGITVEMLTYDSKRGFGSPQAVYAELPRSMGMARREASAVLPSHAAWHYRPNGARSARKAAPVRRRTR